MTDDPVHPGPEASPSDPPIESPGDDGDGMYGWDGIERAEWRNRLARMVAANEASP